MSNFSLSHLSNSTLQHELATFVARDRATTAGLLARIAEFDARKLYRPAGYPSMYAYCVGELHLSEEAAFKRIHAARAARRHSAIFAAVADGRLHLSAVILLAPYLTTENAPELLAAAAHKTKSEIEHLLAQRFPRPDVMAWVVPVPTTAQHAPEHVEDHPGVGGEAPDGRRRFGLNTPRGVLRSCNSLRIGLGKHVNMPRGMLAIPPACGRWDPSRSGSSSP